jgi:hypothetical protein
MISGILNVFGLQIRGPRDTASFRFQGIAPGTGDALEMT